MKGSTNTNKFGKWFQIRWNEKLGYPDDPYLIRWTFILFGFSIRIHKWKASDDNRFFHDHASDLFSIVLKGKYVNVKPYDKTKNPSDLVPQPFFDFDNISIGGMINVKNQRYCHVEGIFNSWHNFLHMSNSMWFSKAEDMHWLSIPKEGAWTLMFEGRPYHKWGFYVNGHKWRPLRYFHKYGIIQDKKYQ